MVRKLFYALAITLLTVSFAAAEKVKSPATEKQEKKEEKPKREPIVDTFTRIDQGEAGVDALVIYAHPLYFAYKGLVEDAKKKYDMEKFHVFIVTINSQKKADLSKFKIESSIFIRTEESLEYPAVSQWIPLTETPSKRTGVVRFFQIDANKNKVLKDNAKSFEVIIKGLADVPERIFKWKLPIEF
ncbi:MAG: hypothetical protein Q7T53_00330 [Deltaproteobacteria bacterium]|nr:hypothetical protein [Deltaproteobacteria bacterium]